ncbi:MAG: hypothetical protein LUG52_00810, partial [Clostridia bacterium]|nr:hypothetical protein [Clostridia bacterium]
CLCQHMAAERSFYMKNNELLQVLETTTMCAPKMTHALREYGGGDMGAGIIALCINVQKHSKKSGMIKGASAAGAILLPICAGGIILVRNHYNKKLKEPEQRMKENINCENEFVIKEDVDNV